MPLSYHTTHVLLNLILGDINHLAAATLAIAREALMQEEDSARYAEHVADPQNVVIREHVSDLSVAG